MAFITLQGTLLGSDSSLSIGDQIRFTHKSTTGKTLQSAVSLLTTTTSGNYYIDLQYGIVLVEYKGLRDVSFKNLGLATVNATNPATSIPELLNALVPVSSDELIEFQTILADCVAVSETLSTGVAAFATLALLTAYTPTAAQQYTSFKVTSDTTSGNNGYYSWSGSAYIKDADLVVNTIDPNNTSDAVSGNAVSVFTIDTLEPLQFEITTDGDYDNFYINFAGAANSDTAYKIVRFPVLAGLDYIVKGQCTGVAGASIGAYAFYSTNTTGSYIAGSVSLLAAGEVRQIGHEVTAPTGATYIFISVKKTIDDLSCYDFYDINQISQNANLANSSVLSIKSDLDVVRPAIGATQTAYNIAVGFVVNYVGNGFFANAAYDVYKYDVIAGRKYRFDSSLTGTNDNQGSTAFGWYATDNTGSLISFELIAKNSVNTFNEYIVAPATATQLLISVKTGVDSNVIQLVPDDNAIATSANAITNAGKKVFFVGDSFTTQGYYFDSVYRESMMIDGSSTGSTGNGKELIWMAYNLINNFTTEITNSSITTILAGANDYLNSTTTVGTIADQPPSLTDIAAGVLPSTVYAAVKAIVNVIMSIDNTTTIVFCSQPEVGNFGGKPASTTAPADNTVGLSMYKTAKAIEDCCNLLGVAYCNTHNTTYNFQQMGIYTYDNLHPGELTGGPRIGRQIGKFLNKL